MASAMSRGTATTCCEYVLVHGANSVEVHGIHRCVHIADNQRRLTGYFGRNPCHPLNGIKHADNTDDSEDHTRSTRRPAYQQTAPGGGIIFCRRDGSFHFREQGVSTRPPFLVEVAFDKDGSKNYAPRNPAATASCRLPLEPQPLHLPHEWSATRRDREDIPEHDADRLHGSVCLGVEVKHRDHTPPGARHRNQYHASGTCAVSTSTK